MNLQVGSSNCRDFTMQGQLPCWVCVGVQGKVVCRMLRIQQQRCGHLCAAVALGSSATPILTLVVLALSCAGHPQD